MELKRYDIGGYDWDCDQSATGDWVCYEDVVPLLTEFTNEVERRMKVEVELNELKALLDILAANPNELIGGWIKSIAYALNKNPKDDL